MYIFRCQRPYLEHVIFLYFVYFLTEEYLLYRILLFSLKPKHESAIGIHISLPFESPSSLPPHTTPLG